MTDAAHERALSHGKAEALDGPATEPARAHAIPSHAAIRAIIENAIRDEARRGNHGYDDLARAVHAALERNHILVDQASKVKLT